MSFRVGQKVVYLGGKKAARGAFPTDPPNLVKGEVYTVRDVDYRGYVRQFPGHDEPTLLLEETCAPVLPTTVGPWETGYYPSFFRPVIERKTDISIFTEMLTPKLRERVEQ